MRTRSVDILVQKEPYKHGKHNSNISMRVHLHIPFNIMWVPNSRFTVLYGTDLIQ